MAIWNHHVYKDNRSELSFLVSLDSMLAIVLTLFNVWNWFLALTGFTTIEFWSNLSLSKEEKQMTFDFSFNSIADNLYQIFGTHKIIRILSPSLRTPPFNGIEWSFVTHE